MDIGTKNLYTREKWLEASLKSIPAGSRILDAGAGEQQYKKYCLYLQYVAQDFAKYDGKGDGKGLQTDAWTQNSLDLICDITQIPEKEGSFDAVMCIEVLEHLPDPLLALKEFTRLLKSGGHLIITAPFCSLTHYAPYHYYSGFSQYYYEKHLRELGYDILEITANGNYYEYIAQEIRRISWVADKYSGDKPGFLEKLAIKIVLKALERFEQKDQYSHELLCYGYQLLAKKI
jgi:ubiquinone/menaquinone biosynthesis C-methylase UbiE